MWLQNVRGCGIKHVFPIHVLDPTSTKINKINVNFPYMYTVFKYTGPLLFLSHHWCSILPRPPPPWDAPTILFPLLLSWNIKLNNVSNNFYYNEIRYPFEQWHNIHSCQSYEDPLFVEARVEIKSNSPCPSALSLAGRGCKQVNTNGYNPKREWQRAWDCWRGNVKTWAVSIRICHMVMNTSANKWAWRNLS